MDQFKLILWALFFTLLVPLIAWTALYSIFGWGLFLALFAAVGVLFFFQDKILKSSAFQGVLQMLIPFALTFRFYDALRAGKEQSKEESNVLKVLWATSRGFLKGDEEATNDDQEDDSASSKKARKAAEKRAAEKRAAEKRAAEKEAEEAFSQLEQEQADASPAKAPTPAPKGPSDEDLDQMLVELKQKMKQKEKVKEAVPESD